MAADVVAAAPSRSDQSSTASLPRHDRATAMSFVTDATTETALRDGLTDVLPEGLDTHRGGIGAAIATLQKIASPQVLIVDISGEDQPLAALGNLSMCVEPDTCVLVVGDVRDLTLYRELTRGLGIAEYLPKPITRDVVGRHFAPLVRGQWPEAERQTGGRLITVTGARGGVGASVIAANLAWYFGITARRHTMLLDADLHRGIAALLLDACAWRSKHPNASTPCWPSASPTRFRTGCTCSPRSSRRRATSITRPTPPTACSRPSAAATTASSPTCPGSPSRSAAICGAARSITSWC
jgi:hypothetical protein